MFMITSNYIVWFKDLTEKNSTKIKRNWENKLMQHYCILFQCQHSTNIRTLENKSDDLFVSFFFFMVCKISYGMIFFVCTTMQLRGNISAECTLSSLQFVLIKKMQQRQHPHHNNSFDSSDIFFPLVSYYTFSA